MWPCRRAVVDWGDDSQHANFPFHIILLLSGGRATNQILLSLLPAYGTCKPQVLRIAEAV